MFQYCLKITLVLILSWVSSACTLSRLSSMLQSESQSLESQVRAYHNQEAKEVRLNWAQARSRMLKEDLVLKRERSQMARIKKRRKNQWREWLPRPSLYLSIQSNINKLSDVTSDDLASTLNAPLAIPNPLSLRAKAYRYALEDLRAEDGYELSERRQVIALYRLFKEWESLEQRYANENQEFKTPEEQLLNIVDAREGEVMMKERKRMLQLRLSRMLNLPGVKVVPVSEKLPKVDYEKSLEKLVPAENYGSLAIRIASYQIVAAVLRSQGVKLGQWSAPGLNVGVPAIYSSNREGNEWLSNADDVNLFSTWGKNFDLTGREAENLETAEEQVTYMRQTLRHRLSDSQHDWERINERYAMLIQKRDIHQSRLARLLSSDSGDALADLRAAQDLIVELEDLERAKLSLDVEIWTWDDDAWK